MHTGRSNRVDSAGGVSANACEPGTQKRVAPQAEDGDANKTEAEPSLRNARMKLIFERAMHSNRSESSERGVSGPRLMRTVVDTAVRQRRLWRAHSSSALGLGTPLNFKRQDLKRFYPNVVRRVHELKLAQTHMRVRVLLLVEDWSSSTPALATHAVVTALVLASVVLLLVLTPLPWSSPDHAALSLADLICSVLLLADWLLRCGLYFSLSCSRKELLRSLTPKIEWLIVDGVASSVHVLSAALTLIQFGDKLAVDLIACLRVLRLISLVRNSKTFDMVLRVLWQSAEALKGPMYWMAVSTVFFGIVVYYIEFFLTPETADIDTLGNAIWYSIVTFSTVGYGDISPTTWLGKVVATFGIVTGMIWFAMPITIIGANFQAEWERCNVRLVAEALQTELLENNEMTQDLFKRFCQIDTNGTNELEEPEFATFLKSHRNLAFMSATEARSVFQILDPLHRGVVTYKELARAVFPVMDVADALATTWNTQREDEDAPGSYCANEGIASPLPGRPPQTTAVSTSAGAFYVEKDAAAVKDELVQLKARVGKLQAGQEDVLAQVAKLQIGQKDMLAHLDKVLAGLELR